MKKVMVLLLVVSTLFNSGCCSIFLGGKETVSVNSKPEGAAVKIGPYQGTTPCQMTMARGKDYAIEITYKDKTKTAALERSIEPLYWVNILVWPGLIVDLCTEKAYRYDPSVYEFTFE